MEYISKTTKVFPDFAAERKAESTLAHVKRGWIPVNPSVLHDIQTKLREGAYVENRFALLHDTKEDLALLTHVAKWIRTKSEEPAPVRNPLRDLLELSEDEIEEMFHVAPNQISRYKLSSCSKLRLGTLKKSILTADAAEVLAGEVNQSGIDIDTESAFSAAAFHEVGWNLIAWNYSELFSSVRRETRKNRELTASRLRQILGVAPGQLSTRLASQWLFDPALREAIAPRTAGGAPLDVIGASAAKLLASIREAVGIFAALETGDASKEDEKQWERCREDLKILAPDMSVDAFEKRVLAAAEAKLDRLNHAASTRRVIVVTERKPEPEPRAPRTFESNRYLSRCPEEVQDVFKPIYEAIQQTGASVEALQSLVSTAIPAAGFRGGCIYMLHETRASLVPAVKIGETFQVIDSRLKTLMAASALESFNSSAPLHKQEQTEQGDVLEHVCASFGDAKRAGVLLLEISKDAAIEPSFDSLMAFKAVRQCLHDCLDIDPAPRE